MTIIVLDAGELIGLEANSRAAWARLEVARRGSHPLIIPTGVIGQVWRNTPQQARLNQALKQCKSIPLDDQTARRAGTLCGRTGTTDEIDAVVALVAHDALREDAVSILTSDLEDISTPLTAMDSTARVVPV